MSQESGISLFVGQKPEESTFEISGLMKVWDMTDRRNYDKCNADQIKDVSFK